MGKISWCALVLGAAASLSAAVTDFLNFERDGKPVLIPAVQKYDAASGVYKFPAKLTVSVPAGEELIVEQLTKELKRFNVAVAAATGKADVRFVVTETGVPENKQGSTLVVSGSGITVSSRSTAGVFYGAQTLRNLLRNAATPEIKACKITDYPDFEYRSYTGGISPDIEASKRTVDALASLKINMITFGAGEAFPYKKNPLTLRKKEYSADQLREIVDFCHKRHIEVVPVVKLLSHTQWMTYHPHWDKMKEGEPNKLWNSLNCLLNEENRELVRMTIEENIELFKPSIFYVGMDEVWFCPFRECPRCKAMAPKELLADYLNFVKGILDKHGVRMSVCQDSSLNNPSWPYGDWFREQLPKDTLIRWWRYSDVLPEEKMVPFKGFQIMGIGLSGKPFNVYNMAHLVKKYGGNGCGMTYWYYTIGGHLGKPENNTPNSYGGTVNCADYIWKLRDTPYTDLGYDGTFEMMRIMYPELLTLPPRTLAATPLPLGRSANAELSTSGKFPRFADDAATAELKAALAKLPERFELLTAPGGKYYGLRLNGYKGGGRMAIQIPCHDRKAAQFSFLLTASRPRNGADYLCIGGGAGGRKHFLYEPAARIVIEYADGKKVAQELRYRQEITDWNRPFGGCGMRFAVRGVDADRNYYTFGIYDLKNPHPEKPVKSLIFHTLLLDGISPVMLAATAWGADKPFPADKFDAAKVDQGPGIKADPKPKIRIAQDFENGMGDVTVQTSPSLKNAVRSAIVADPTSPSKSKVLKITIPPGKYEGIGKDHNLVRVDVYMPYRIAKGTKALALDHRIVCDPKDFSRSWEYLFNGPPPKRHAKMYGFRPTEFWKRELRGNGRFGRKPLRVITNTRYRMISFFFTGITKPVEIYLDNIGDTAGNHSIVPLWKAGMEEE